MADSLGQRGIDSVFADVALDAPVVYSGSFILRQRTALELVLMRGSPCGCQHFGDSSHCLRVRRHDADRSDVVQDIFGRDGLFSDAVLQERGVLGVVFRQAVAVGCHVDVLGDRVYRERHRRGRTAGQHIVVSYQLNHIRCMSTTSAFDVVDVYTTAFEDRSGVFEEASFVEAVGVDVALDIVLFAHTAREKVSIFSTSHGLCGWNISPQTILNGRGRTAEIFMQLERNDSGIDLVLESNFLGIAAFSHEAKVQG